MSFVSLRNIKDTTLWQRLDSGFKNTDGEEIAATLAGNLIGMCSEAADWMKAVPSLMPQFTLHDQVHLLRVTELMAKVAGPVVERLNPAEIALLILSAHYHDHGMVLDGSSIQRLEADAGFRLFSANWLIAHPNLREIESRIGDSTLSPPERVRLSRQAEDLRRGLVTEYLRNTHAERSRELVQVSYVSDPRWSISGVNIAGLVGVLCESHGRDPRWLQSQNGIYCDRAIGTLKVNAPYVGVLLRLADILDFDRDRTPDSLYRAIHFTNEISIREWEKHRSVQGWEISSQIIRFTAECSHPAYERAVRRFMDWIDHELVECHTIVRSFPGELSEQYRLEAPQSVDRGRIGPHNNAYRYHELEFSLSRDEIVQLLMTDKLYRSPSLCVRELLQNALDALRHRKAMHGLHKTVWSAGEVRIEHALDEAGYEIVRCTDNGVGMSEDIVTNFLTRAGRSYYRSPEFEQERARFRTAGVDFDPCARFGIGFMSCFMLGDRITIRTRRDFGPDRGHGAPLVVEINGLGGLVVIRDGASDQPVGTTVEIVGRKKPTFLSHWDDKVRLIPVVSGYALATEFPIHAVNNVPELIGKISIPQTVATKRPTLEVLDIKSRIDLVQDFSEIDSRLRGSIHSSFLIDERGLPTIKNSDASLRIEHATEPNNNSHVVVVGNGAPRKANDEREPRGATCVDGILVAGTPGRERPNHYLGWHANPVSLFAPFVLDIRGDIKPELTPARTPIEDWHWQAVGWRRIRKLAHRAEGRLWEQLARYSGRGLTPQTFWSLCAFHHIQPSEMRAGVLWDQVRVPVHDTAGDVEWLRFSELGELTCIKGDKSLRLNTADGRNIGTASSLNSGDFILPVQADDTILRTVLSMCSVASRDSNKGLVLRPEVPDSPDVSPAALCLSRSSFVAPIPLPLHFKGQLSKCLTTDLPFETANVSHPIYTLALNCDEIASLTDVQIFARSVIDWLCGTEFTTAIPDGKGLPTRGLKWLGHQYRSIDWSGLSPDLAPPYVIFAAGKGFIDITKQNFEEWAELELGNETVDVDDDLE